VGLITANAGITVATGQTVNIGTSLTTSPLNVRGLITGTLGLTITGANTSLTTLSTSGLLSADAGIMVANGQTLNVGTSGDTTPSNFWGLTTIKGNTVLNGTGNSSISLSSVYVNPNPTTVAGASNYYFTSFARPSTIASTTGSAYTVFIDGPPSGTITSPFALYVNSGITYMGGTFRYAVSPTNLHVLQCNGSGDASWVDVASLPSPSITNYSIATAVTEDTTSTTAVDIPSMTLTPAAGTYYITFFAVCRLLTNNRTVNVRLAKNGLQIANTLAVYSFSATNIDATISVSTLINLNGTDIITAQFWIGGGAGTIRLSNQKILSAIRVGS
jgi:hypothetical protein